MLTSNSASTSFSSDGATVKETLGQIKVTKLNDHLYKVSRGWTPEVEVVFFHGLTRSPQEEKHLTTWRTPDGSVCWPIVWIPELFRGATVYLVSYDSSIQRTFSSGGMDMYLVGESIFQLLLLEDVGQNHRCPLILVGHDLGGLVIKQICLHACRQTQNMKATLFLEQLRGICFLATPHAGLTLYPPPGSKQSMLYEDMGVLHRETARLNAEFNVLKDTRSWKTRHLHPAHGRKDGQLNWSNEASGRFGGDRFLFLDTDSENIARPADKRSGCFPSLRRLIEEVLSEFAGRLGFVPDPLYVPLRNTLRRVETLLLKEKVVLLCGEPGTGKTSLVKHLAYQYGERGDGSVFRDGCYFIECDPGVKAEKIQQRLLSRLVGVNGASRYERVEDYVILQQELERFLGPRDVLIILDNVWDDDLIDKLVVPGKVKYLLTGQQANLGSRHIDKIEICTVEDIGKNYGKQILARRMRFPRDIIPEDLQVVVDRILDVIGCNPLALATLSATIRYNLKTSPGEWFDKLQHIYDFLKVKERGQIHTQESTYPRGFSTSMMYAVKRLSEEDPHSMAELEMLSIISLLQGPAVPCRLIRLLTRCIRPELEAKIEPLLMVLENLTLIQRRTFGCQNLCSVIDCVSINPIRQHYMLSSPEKPLVSIRKNIELRLSQTYSKSLPYKPENIRLAHALCILYGVEYTRKFVEGVLGGPRALHFMAMEALQEYLLPFVFFIDEFSNHPHARQMLERLLLEGTMHTESILELFKMTPSDELNISGVLMDLFLAMNPRSYNDLLLPTFEYSFYGLLNLFLVHRKVEEALSMLMAFIGGVTCSTKFAAKLSGPMLRAIFDSGDALDPVEESILEAWSVLDIGSVPNNLRVTNKGSRPHVTLAPGALKTLVSTVNSADADREEIQLQAVALLTFIITGDPNPDLLFIPGMLESFLSVLRRKEDSGCLSRNDSVNLVTFSEALTILALKHAFNHGLRITARLAESEDMEILIRDAMTTLVRRALNARSTNLGHSAVKIITHLAYQLHCVELPNLQEALVEALFALQPMVASYKHRSPIEKVLFGWWLLESSRYPGEFLELRRSLSSGEWSDQLTTILQVTVEESSDQQPATQAVATSYFARLIKGAWASWIRDCYSVYHKETVVARMLILACIREPEKRETMEPIDESRGENSCCFKAWRKLLAATPFSSRLDGAGIRERAPRSFNPFRWERRRRAPYQLLDSLLDSVDREQEWPIDELEVLDSNELMNYRFYLAMKKHFAVASTGADEGIQSFFIDVYEDRMKMSALDIRGTIEVIERYNLLEERRSLPWTELQLTCVVLDKMLKACTPDIR
ncbi:hypothetical protein R1flu_025867 [Riccia fluitans]|uniref:AAA+ ATPase domain-containing protein n=1 Tax=Riccia fluitans TaxID=41844 RepID=A0ABD1XYY7_9MARC